MSLDRKNCWENTELFWGKNRPHLLGSGRWSNLTRHQKRYNWKKSAASSFLGIKFDHGMKSWIADCRNITLFVRLCIHVTGWICLQFFLHRLDYHKRDWHYATFFLYDNVFLTTPRYLTKPTSLSFEGMQRESLSFPQENSKMEAKKKHI